MTKHVDLSFNFGAKVHIDGCADLKATVTGFCIYPHGMQVQVSWFANGDHKNDWFAEWRLALA